MLDGADDVHVVVEDLPGVGHGSAPPEDVAPPGQASPGFRRILPRRSSSLWTEFLEPKLRR